MRTRGATSLADAWWDGVSAPSCRAPLEPELALWTAVIEQAISDSWRGPRAGSGAEQSSTARRNERDRARDFLRGCGSLRWIWLWLDIEPSWWAAVILPALERQWAEIDAGLGPRRFKGQLDPQLGLGLRAVSRDPRLDPNRNSGTGTRRAA